MSAAADLRASLIERGFITPNPTLTPEPIAPINRYQSDTLVVQNTDFDDDPSARDQYIDVYHDRFAGPVVAYSRDGVREGRTGESWQLPPLKNQWQHDWRRRVEAGQPALRLRAPRWAFYGGA